MDSDDVEVGLPPSNGTSRDPRCLYLDYNYSLTMSIFCGMYLVFGIVYSLFGYRCFKAVMFLTGFAFASVVVYAICLGEQLLTPLGNTGDGSTWLTALVIGAAVGAGVMFGLITMLVQYVGLFMTGLHTGVCLGVAGLAILQNFYLPPTLWIVVGILLGAALLFAMLTLYWQKGLTIIGTSIYGGAIMAASVDYFIEKWLMVYWMWDKVRLAESQDPCWFSWFILSVWPFMVIVGGLTQWRVTGRGTYHQELRPSKKARSVNLHRIRSREERLEARQKKYRYLYRVRTAHGDVISQSYIQSLQRKAEAGAGDTSTLQSDATHLTILPPPEHTQLHTHIEGATHLSRDA